MREWRSRIAAAVPLAAAALASLVVVLYVVNSIRHNEATLQGDQWFWVSHVLVPLEDGRMSLFDAVTFEYQSFAHSHIPTLFVFLINDAWFGLTPTIDTVVGVLSLSGVVVIAWRHLADAPPAWRRLAVAVIAGSIFVSSDPSNFVWSLLQFQMFYVLVAVVYLERFGARVENPSARFAVFAIPGAMILGDSMGSAAVAASLIYLTLLVIARRTPWRKSVPYFATFVTALLVLKPIIGGQRQHGGGSATDFADYLVSEPADVAKAIYYALAQAVVAFHTNVSGLGIVRWSSAWFWFVATVALLVAAAVGVRRFGWQTADHFPIMLMLASLVWTGGVIRARATFWGPVVMQQPRYAAYTAVFGVGLVLLVATKAHRLRWGGVLVAAVLVGTLAGNTAVAIATTQDDSGERVQENQLKRLRAYVETESEAAPILGLDCSDWSSCLEGAWYLWDRKLGPFADDAEPREPWLIPFREAVYDRYHDADAAGKIALCETVATATSEDWLQDLTDPNGLASYIEATGAEIPADSVDEAAAITGKAMRVKCASFELAFARAEVGED